MTGPISLGLDAPEKENSENIAKNSPAACSSTSRLNPQLSSPATSVPELVEPVALNLPENTVQAENIDSPSEVNTLVESDASQNIVVCYVNATAEPETNITSYEIGLAEELILPARKLLFPILEFGKTIFTLVAFAYQTVYESNR
ncbi:hypothetical protein TNCT_220481 [Trichonephila clavata]|uniref:Uncharacterized protein n=1 Tax=Trichonephila clavata TaxID=2740835 RepID=A0A8X6KJL3_TRICU|nr:hypothetical protein TNCT_220481 [Trichonephila clavata]